MKEHWNSPLPYYSFKCSKHGTVYNYPSGFDQKLICPKCLEELKNRYRNRFIP